MGNKFLMMVAASVAAALITEYAKRKLMNEKVNY